MILAMGQSLGFVLVHVVFSTWERRAVLHAEVRTGLHAYLASVVRDSGCECYRVGGVADHVHLAIRLARTVTVADLVRDLEANSSGG